MARLLSPLRALLVLGLAAAVAPVAAAQDVPVRFEVGTVGDTTIVFAVDEGGWIKVGAEGIVVDAQRRDALVASIRVIDVSPTTVRAVVTGQTTRVAPGHIVILRRPPPPFYARRTFWGGLVLGIIAGAVVGAQ